MPPLRQGLFRSVQTVEQTLDISENNTLAEAVDLGVNGLIGLIIPTLNGDVTIEVLVSHNGQPGTFHPIYDNAGTQFTIAAGAGDIAISTDYMAACAAYRWVRLRMDTAQIADRTFRWILKG